MIKIYGIKNCDTMKKAFKWLDSQNIAYDFHDYKKQGMDETAITQAIAEHGWETVINKRGTTWRKLDDGTKNAVNDQTAVKLANDNPSIVKRPLIVKNGKSYLGFDDAVYKDAFLD